MDGVGRSKVEREGDENSRIARPRYAEETCILTGIIVVWIIGINVGVQCWTDGRNDVLNRWLLLQNIWCREGGWNKDVGKKEHQDESHCCEDISICGAVSHGAHST